MVQDQIFFRLSRLMFDYVSSSTDRSEIQLNSVIKTPNCATPRL